MQYHHYSITQNVVFVQLCCAIFYILGMFSITTTVSRIAINIFIYILIFIFVAYTRLALLKSCTFGNSDHPYLIKLLFCFKIFCDKEYSVTRIRIFCLNDSILNVSNISNNFNLKSYISSAQKFLCSGVIFIKPDTLLNVGVCSYKC